MKWVIGSNFFSFVNLKTVFLIKISPNWSVYYLCLSWINLTMIIIRMHIKHES